MPSSPLPAFHGADRPHGEARAGRSPVLARNGMVAASQPLAAQAGLRVLQEGGNAFDAAVATAATLAVVEPMMTGPGGDLFVLAHVAETGERVGLNASGFSPQAATPDFFSERGLASIPLDGAFSVTVPGAVDGWITLLERYGSWPLERVLAPAIGYAEDGFPVSEIIGGDWGVHAPKSTDLEFRRVYLKDDGAPYAHGDVFHNPDLARTLRAIARLGRDGFYSDLTGEAIVVALQQRGWPLTADDLAFQRSDWVEPIATTYRGVEVFELPPNGQGMATLSMLNLLEGFEPAALGHNSADLLHVMIETKKLAYADLAAWLADPEQARLPTAELISKPYAARRRSAIDPLRAAERVSTGVAPGASDTVYLTVVDRDRNAVSFINSLFHSFGSKLVAPGTGVILQNRGALFTLAEGHPNRIAPRKRPYHTIIPAMACRDGRPWLSFGVMGGDMQPQGQAQVLVNRVDFGMNVQLAGEAARFRHNPDDGVSLESGVGATVATELARRGHVLGFKPGVFGGYQAIEIDWERGILIGGTDPRKDGVVAAW